MRMAHTSFKSLIKRYSLSPFPLKESKLAYEFLRKIFSEEEAYLASKLPIKFTPLGKIAERIKIPQLEKKLDKMAERGIVMDIEIKGEKYYMLLPLMPGLIEFMFMRERNDIDQDEIAKMIEEAFEREFIANVFKGIKYHRARILVLEESLDDVVEILPYETASDVVREAKAIAVGVCFCRHEREHAGFECKFPKEVCITLNTTADFVARRNFGRKVDKEKAIDILSETSELGLIHIGDYVKRRLGFICNCCKCCCGFLRTYNTHRSRILAASNFVAMVKKEKCAGCGRCARHCPANAITLKPTKTPGELKAEINNEICLGCGICRKFCGKDAIHLERREKTYIPPESIIEREMIAAIDEGRIQDIIFSDPESITHNIARRILSMIIKLPPTKQAFLNKNLKSKFVSLLLSRT